MAFTPKGDRAQRVIVAELAGQAEFGTLLTFAQLAEALGVGDDEAGRVQVRAAVGQARPLLLADHGRALVARRGAGYRVALPGELAGVAEDYRSRGDKAFSRALAVFDRGDTRSMTQGELQLFRATGAAFRGMVRRMNAQDDRIADLETAVFGRQRGERPVIQGQAEQQDQGQPA